jgi:hypothetical protein
VTIQKIRKKVRKERLEKASTYTSERKKINKMESTSERNAEITKVSLSKKKGKSNQKRKKVE